MQNLHHILLHIFCYVAEAPIEMPRINLDIPMKKIKEVEIEMPNFDKKPRFEFPLRDRYIQERDTFRLTASLDVDIHPTPTVRLRFNFITDLLTNYNTILIKNHQSIHPLTFILYLRCPITQL